MDRAEFQRYIDNALQKAERVRTYCTNDEIILVMTEDFYRELCALVEIPANRDVDNYGILFPYGYRIAVINEPTERTMVSPAMLGMTYHPYMALDDIIVVDEENRVFRLASRDPVQFTDTGMTVRFDAHTRTPRMDTAVIDAGNIAAEAMRAATAQVATTTATFETITTTATTTGDNWQQYWVNPATWEYNPTVTFRVDTAEINHFNKIFYEMKKRYNLRTAKEWLETEYSRRKKNRIKEDAELSAGDTKAMDELLDGFAIKQNLQQA